MKAIVQTGYGPPERVLRVAELEPPAAGDREVLVRVKGTSVNTPDWIVVTGIPYVLRLQSGLRGPKTPVRGTDVAGVVEAVGSGVTDLVVGDEVLGSVWGDGGVVQRHGTFAELTAVPADCLIPKPARLSWEEAGAAVMSGITAMTAMQHAGPGARVLINGASGGVGTLAVQFAKARGAEVTGVCSSRNVELVRSLGADHVIDYGAQDFTRAETQYDVILDNVLNRPPAETVRALAPSGVLIPNSVGNTGGMLAGLPRMARARLMARKVDVRFVSCVPDRPNLEALAERLGSGAVRVVVDRTFPLEQAPEAVAHMLTHRARGKVAITA